MDRTFRVPLDHAKPDGETIEVYAREVTSGRSDLPYLLYLNGGPGVQSPRPLGGEGWLRRALADYRLLLLDQRGTGRSTPVTRHSLAKQGTPQQQASYLKHFRADSIVRDAELIRRQVTSGKWSVLGQSYGGYCAVTYLSFAPEGLSEVFTTGGLPGLESTADDVYRILYKTVLGKNTAHFERYPQDVERAHSIARFLRDNTVRLPAGRPLTVEAFQGLGNLLGSATGSIRLHYLLEAPFDGDQLADAFLVDVERELSWASTSPLYFLLHEASYARGEGATNWAAQRVRGEFPEFDKDDPLLFTGEMVYPSLFDTDPALAPFRETAHILAQEPTWTELYDVAQLKANEVPVAAAVYHDDMYVARELSMETARTIAGARPWLTAEYEHDGLRVSDGAVLDRLISMLRRGEGPGHAG
ncbi:pimeloyl-ACP methyl ester carboxylesterase [Actinokineospora baliensis]|uniref:alpha/beta fold hydrolase n=1 Tax=Actinokineospora baliensis TaxID=547056 RepID=UPI0027DADF21|nr:alpha/beta fold hydrolase [Actinokineospora baliensis]MBM7775341.1 pimeloyl-ACP methyl ester carboxylesterase [Actinokineospora baliensis]